MRYVIFFLLTATLMGTAQIGENLLYRGKTYTIRSEPLEHYFSKEQKKPKILRAGVDCHTRLRGYIGSWEIKDQKLYLTHLTTACCGTKDEDQKQEVSLSQIFPNTKKEIFAMWYSGVITIPMGKPVLGYDALFEKITLIEIKAGNVVDTTTLVYEDIPYRSIADLRWCCVKPIKDEGNWTDFRGVKIGKQAVNTRGILIQKKSDFYLHIPKTAKTASVDLKIKLEKKNELKSGSFVSVVIQKGKDGVIVQEIKPLKRGMTIHHPKFIKILKRVTGEDQSSK